LQEKRITWRLLENIARNCSYNVKLKPSWTYRDHGNRGCPEMTGLRSNPSLRSELSHWIYSSRVVCKYLEQVPVVNTDLPNMNSSQNKTMLLKGGRVYRAMNIC